MAKNKKAPKGSTFSADDDGLDDLDATPAKAAKPAKGKKTADLDDLDDGGPAKGKKGFTKKDLAGKTIKITEKGTAMRAGTLKAQIVAAFKGANGAKYETGIGRMTDIVQPRGKESAKNRDVFLRGYVIGMVREGFLEVV